MNSALAMALSLSLLVGSSCFIRYLKRKYETVAPKEMPTSRLRSEAISGRLFEMMLFSLSAMPTGSTGEPRMD